MCGRFKLSKPVQAVGDLFAMPAPPEILKPRYNVAPSQRHPVAFRPEDVGAITLAVMKWGFVPRWAKEPGTRPINAKSETVATNGLFRASFKGRRCLIPADGYYEWTGKAGSKKATLYEVRGGQPFAFAGIWDRFTSLDNPPLDTFAVLTCPANELAAEVHDRMPVVMTRESFDRWLDPKTSAAEALALLVSFPASLMTATKVGPLVNSPKNDGPECVAPAA